MISRLFNTDAFDLIFCLADACCVDDMQRYAADLCIFFDGIARRPRNFRDNGALLTKERIEQA